MGVGDLAVVQDLQQHVEHVRMGLFDLVEEDHGVGLAADLLRQLARLVIAHIARRRAHDPGHGVLLHKLGHIQTDQRVGGVEQVLRQALDQLGLAHAGGTHKDEADRLMLGADAHPVAADGGGHGLHRLILAHDVLLEPVLQLAQPLELLLPDAGGRDLGPQLDDVGQVLHGQLRVALGAEGIELRGQLQLPALELRHAGVILLGLFLLVLQGLALQLIVVPLPLDLHAPGDGGVLQVQVGAGLVNEVDGLVRQEAVGDVPLAQQHRLTQNAVGNLHPVVALIIGRNALEDLQGVLDAGLVHRHRLEPALQGRILLDVLAVLGEGGGADDLDLAPAQGGLEDIGGVHGPFGVAGTHDIVDLVDDQDHVAQLADLVDEALHPGLELAPELGPRHQGGQIQQIDLLLPELEGHCAVGNPLGQALGDGSLAHAGLTDEAGIVLLAAVEDLDDPLDLLLPAHHLVQLAVPGPLAEVDAVAVQVLVLGRLFPLAPGAGAGGAVPLLRRVDLLRCISAGEEAVEEGEGGGLAVVLFVHAVLAAGQVLDVLCPAEGLDHLVVEGLQVLIRDAHALHHVIHLGQSQLLGTFQAEALIDRLAVFDLGNEHHGHIFLTS